MLTLGACCPPALGANPFSLRKFRAAASKLGKKAGAARRVGTKVLRKEAIKQALPYLVGAAAGGLVLGLITGRLLR